MSRASRFGGWPTPNLGSFEDDDAISIVKYDVNTLPLIDLDRARPGRFEPSCADRSDCGCGTHPERCAKTIEKRPTAVKQLYFDSIVFTSEAATLLNIPS